MAKPLKSQWNFGELFPPETLRRVFTVSELTTTVKRLLEKEIGLVWVTGEISNLRAQSSGHFYFTIKDAAAQLSCVLFRGEAQSIDRQLLQDGRKVVLHGELTVYEARGQYQLRVINVELQGSGRCRPPSRDSSKAASGGPFRPGAQTPAAALSATPRGGDLAHRRRLARRAARGAASAAGAGNHSGRMPRAGRGGSRRDCRGHSAAE